MVAGWDTATITDRLELRVGKDLQFVRVNGTLVGFLVGGLVYAALRATFGSASFSCGDEPRRHLVRRSRMLRLSVLDQSTIVTGRSPDASIRESLALARHCESLGYARYWLAEHHNSEAIAGTAPEVLIAAIAATTTRIRVGSAGVMLPHYSASMWRSSSVCWRRSRRAGSTSASAARPAPICGPPIALNPNADTAADRFPAQIARSARLAVRRATGRRATRSATCAPTRKARPLPEVWVLGSSGYGAQVAAFFGLPYCFAHFITDGHGAEQALALYRENYRPSARHPAPHPALCVWALAADTEAEAERLFSSRVRYGGSGGTGAPTPPCPPRRRPPPTPIPRPSRPRIARVRGRADIGHTGAASARAPALAAAERGRGDRGADHGS